MSATLERTHVMDVATAARIVREALKDRSYRATPLGLEIARYYRWKKNEWGAAAETMRDYEAILARLAVFHADLALTDFTPLAFADMVLSCAEQCWMMEENDCGPCDVEDTLSILGRDLSADVWMVAA